MLILHVSDTHLGAMPGGLLFRLRDILEAFKETIDIAIREHVDVYLHAGDFFDRAHPPPEAYVVAYRQLKRLRESGIKTIVIAGQHDMPRRYSLSPLALLSEAEVVDYLVVDDIQRFNVGSRDGLEVEFVAVPYGQRKKISLARPSTRPSVLVAHLLLKELDLPGNAYDVSIHDIPQGFSYVALGDYHGHRVFRHVDGTPVVYPGATEVLRRDEYSEDGKYVVLVDLSCREPSIQKIRLESVRPWIMGRYNDAKRALEDIVRRVYETVNRFSKKPIVYVELLAGIATALYRELEVLAKRGLIEYFVIDSLSEESKREVRGAPSHEYEYIDIKSIIKEFVGDDRLVDLLLSLVQEPSDTIARKLIETLHEDEELLKKLEQSMRGLPLTTSRSSSSMRSQQISRAKDLTSFLRSR